MASLNPSPTTPRLKEALETGGSSSRVRRRNGFQSFRPDFVRQWRPTNGPGRRRDGLVFSAAYGKGAIQREQFALFVPSPQSPASRAELRPKPHTRRDRETGPLEQLFSASSRFSSCAFLRRSRYEHIAQLQRKVYMKTRLSMRGERCSAEARAALLRQSLRAPTD